MNTVTVEAGSFIRRLGHERAAPSLDPHTLEYGEGFTRKGVRTWEI